MKLNLGCGDRYVSGWTNVDFQTPRKVDERVDLTGPLPKSWRGNVKYIYAGHLLEHITEDECHKLAKRLLKVSHPDGCLFVAVGPDVEVAEEMVYNGTFDHTWGTLDEIKNGAGRWAGDVHMWETTGRSVGKIIQDAGWPVVRVLSLDVLPNFWPVADRTQKWQYVVRAWTGSDQGDK